MINVLIISGFNLFEKEFVFSDSNLNIKIKVFNVLLKKLDVKWWIVGVVVKIFSFVGLFFVCF